MRDVCMFVTLLLADHLYTDAVDSERGQLPSPAELKGKILVKVHAYIRTLWDWVWCISAFACRIGMCKYSVLWVDVRTYVHTYH